LVSLGAALAELVRSFRPPPRSPEEAALVAECRAIIARHARSFDRASTFLPPVTRDRVAVLYAFCRSVDDAVDEAPSYEAALAAIGALKDELRTATGQDVSNPPRPVVSAFVRYLGGSSVALAAAHELCDGVASDLHPARVADDAELLRYCYRVAGTVGVMLCPTLGVTDARALPFAIDLGIAMQLTNICRDVLEDAERGRVYLPASRLAGVGTTPEALLAGTADHQAVASVTLDLIALADRYYASADLGLRYIPLLGRQAILVARALYAAIGHKLRRQGGDALKGRTMVAPRDKPALIVGALAHNLRPDRRDHPEHDAVLHLHLGGLPGTAPVAAPR
jgi:phytoene synthase